MESLIREWEGESVLIRFDRPTGTWMFIAIHSTGLGVASGGTRLKSYPHPRDALRDAMRLAEGPVKPFKKVTLGRIIAPFEKLLCFERSEGVQRFLLGSGGAGVS